MSTDSDDKIIDLSKARNRLEPVRKEKAAEDLRQQFEKAMGWNAPKSKSPKGGGKGSKKGKKK